MFLGIPYDFLLTGIRFVLTWWWVWLPILGGVIFWTFWIQYIRARFIDQKEPILLEIKIPKEITKSPLAMEIVLNALYNTGGEGTWIKRYWEGSTRPWFSLEMISLEGRVHFFVWTWKDSQKAITTHLYSQYPDIEVHEVPDYAMTIMQDDSESQMWGTEFELTKSDAYPIKTYIDYGLDKDPKEEYKIDPITPVIEYLGGLGPKEQAWIQILVRAHKKEDKKKGAYFEKTDKWQDDAKTEIEKIVSGRKIKGSDPEDKSIKLTPIETEVVAALERSVAKYGFDVGIRGVYIAHPDFYNKAHQGGLTGTLKQYSTNHLNGFKPTRGTDFDYPWQDITGNREKKKKEKMFDAYRLRSYFHAPYKRPYFVLNSEELATIFHLPGRVAQTPTFDRIESRKAEPPANLPI